MYDFENVDASLQATEKSTGTEKSSAPADPAVEPVTPPMASDAEIDRLLADLCGIRKAAENEVDPPAVRDYLGYGCHTNCQHETV